MSIKYHDINIGSGGKPVLSDSTPQMDGTGSSGVSEEVSRADHEHPSDTSRVPVFGMGENLLRNWYFVGGGTGRGVFPVNQRGATSGTSSATIIIDGWASDSTWRLDSDGIYLEKRSGSSYNASVSQHIKANQIPEGMRTVTLSVLWSDGTFWTNSGTLEWSGAWQCTSGTVNSDGCAIRLHNSMWQIGIWNGNTNKKLQAAKVELGSQQTLCHNEGTAANPVWVLNEIPNYEAELIKCQTSTADSTDTYANKTLATEQQLAYVESGTTASRAYYEGDYFCLGGVLCRAKTAIAQGDSFTLNTNYEAPDGGIANQNFAKYAGTAVTGCSIVKNSDSRVIISLFTGAGNTNAAGTMQIDFNGTTARFRIYDGTNWTNIKTW